VEQDSSGVEDGRVITLAAMDGGVDDHESAVEQKRAELAHLLTQPRVQELAHARGINIDQVESAASSLSDQQMEEVAPLVAEVTPFMQNRLGSVTVRVATVVTILLVLIFPR
jgi:hypothetical protein